MTYTKITVELTVPDHAVEQVKDEIKECLNFISDDNQVYDDKIETEVAEAPEDAEDDDDDDDFGDEDEDDEDDEDDDDYYDDEDEDDYDDEDDE